MPLTKCCDWWQLSTPRICKWGHRILCPPSGACRGRPRLTALDTVHFCRSNNLQSGKGSVEEGDVKGQSWKRTGNRKLPAVIKMSRAHMLSCRIQPSPSLCLLVEVQAAGDVDFRLASCGWTQLELFDHHNQVQHLCLHTAARTMGCSFRAINYHSLLKCLVKATGLNSFSLFQDKVCEPLHLPCPSF